MTPLQKTRRLSPDTLEPPSAQRPKPNEPAPGEARTREDVPDLAQLEVLVRTIDKLRAPGVEERPWVGAHEFRILSDVEQDGFEVWTVPRGCALKTSGVSACYAICAMSVTADGQTLAGLSHTSLSVNRGMSPQQAAVYQVKMLLDAMSEEGAAGPVRLFVAGGHVSLLAEVEEFFVAGDVSMTPAKPEQGTFADGPGLIEAAGDLLVSARIGLSETGEYPQSVLDRDGLRMSPSTGRPEAVSVYVTHDSVFYVAESNDDCRPDEADEGDEGDLPELLESLESLESSESSESDLSDSALLTRLRAQQEAMPEGLPWLPSLTKPET